MCNELRDRTKYSCRANEKQHIERSKTSFNSQHNANVPIHIRDLSVSKIVQLHRRRCMLTFLFMNEIALDAAYKTLLLFQKLDYRVENLTLP